MVTLPVRLILGALSADASPAQRVTNRQETGAWRLLERSPTPRRTHHPRSGLDCSYGARERLRARATLDWPRRRSIMPAPPTDPSRSTAAANVLPTGTLTFLFTDIAGSTKLLSTLGERYAEVLARHNEIIRGALNEYEGHEVSTEGDAFFAVFRSAPQAVAAVARAQQQLHAEAWPQGASLRVRMGLHSGEGRLGGDNYTGLDVNRAARIAAAGHGGQVLLSDSTYALVSHESLDGLTFRDLGPHRLKDLPAPEHVWQLDIDGLPGEFPPLRSLDARPTNLPVATTSLIGREREMAEVTALVGRSRLLTLTGTGGTGKTRLALAAAHQLLADFADGCFFVALQDAHDRQSVSSAIASALGVRETTERDLEEGLRKHLRERELLLVLDNFEQVLSAAPLIGDLLAGSPRLRVIVTSRERLHLSGERDVDVPPLGLPDPARLPPLAALSQYEAVALFIERAGAARAGFAVTNENALAVAQICARLDGLPLAIELAAARVRLLTPQAILDRLERRLQLLTGGPRDAPDRQRTLRDTIAWSYDLLDDAEKAFFERLSVFAGGWTVEAADDVCNAAGELGIETFDGLASLADKSLIRPMADDSEERFAMLQVIREYAGESLEARPDAELVRRRHVEYVLRLVEQAEPRLLLSDVRQWQHRLKREEDNVRAALRWATERGEAEVAMRLAGALWRFWLYWARLREGRDWLESVVAMDGGAQSTLARAKALTALAGVLYWQGVETERMADLYEEALAFYSERGDDAQVGGALINSTWGAVAKGDIPRAVERAKQALARFEAAGDPVTVATARAGLGALQVFLGVSDRPEETLAAVQEAIEANRRAGRLHDAADWTGAIAQANWIAGRYREAADAARAALRGFHEMGNVGLYPMAIKAIAAFELADKKDPERVVMLAAAAERLFDELGGQLAVMARFGDPLNDARQRLSAEEHERAVAEGRAMSADEAVAYALASSKEVSSDG
jgi:predicted ATPase/class 3 adenylate cyclase